MRIKMSVAVMSWLLVWAIHRSRLARNDLTGPGELLLHTVACTGRCIWGDTETDGGGGWPSNR
jgi:hypothetical protein